MGHEQRWPRLHAAPPWRERTDAERGRAVEAACRTAMQLLEDAPDRERRLMRRDPLPASTRALLRRLAERSRHA